MFADMVYRDSYTPKHELHQFKKCCLIILNLCLLYLQLNLGREAPEMPPYGLKNRCSDDLPVLSGYQFPVYFLNMT